MSDDLHRYRLLLAFGADLSAHPSTWGWSDMADPATRPPKTTSRLRAETALATTSGRANETGRPQPGSLSTLLDNQDGALTPRRAMSQWSPHVRRGTPARLDVHTDRHHLALEGSGSRASTPDNAALHVTEPWFAIRLAAPIWIPPTGVVYEVSGRFNAGGNQRSFLLYWGSDGVPKLRWSTDGTAATEIDGFPAWSPFPIHGGWAIAAHLDPNDGAGGHTVAWYSGRTIEAIEADLTGHLFDTYQGAGTTSVHAGTSPLEIGDITNSGFTAYPGNVEHLKLREGGPAGTVVADLDVTALAEAATGTTDPAGRVWAFTNASVTGWRQVRTWRVDKWDPTWPHGDITGLAQTGIRGSGVLQRLRKGRARQALDSTLYRRINAPAVASQVVGYWPMEDAAGATQFASPTPGAQAGSHGGLQLASDSTLASSKPLPRANPGQAFAWAVNVPVRTASTWRVDRYVFIETPVTTPVETLLYQIHSTGTVRRWTFSCNDVALIIRGFNSADTEITGEGLAVLPGDYGQWVRFGLSWTQNGGNVDWTATIVHVGGDIFGYTESVAGTVGRITKIACLNRVAPAEVPPDGMSAGHLIVSTGLPSDWLEDGAFVSGAGAAFLGEPAGVRFARLCTEENIPHRIQGDPSDTTLMGPQRPAPLMTLLDECVDADMGLGCELPHELGLGMRCRTTLYNQTPALTIDAGLINPFAPTEDDQGIVNDVTVTRVDGSSARVVDDQSVADEDLYDEAITLNVESDLQLDPLAGWRLHLGTPDEMRYSALPVLLTKAPHLIPEWLDTGPGDIARVTELPAESPTPEVDLMVQGDSNSILPATWSGKLNTTPASVWDVGVWDDEDRGRYDTAGSETTADFDTGTDTSLSVATTVGLVWETDAAEMPFDIEAAGVQLRVTAVTGATSPQTFTVDQAPVNGVTKTIPAGTRVQLWLPAIAAL